MGPCSGAVACRKAESGIPAATAESVLNDNTFVRSGGLARLTQDARTKAR